MANNHSGDGRSRHAGQAMNRVLQAERDAEQAVADCEQQAREVLHDAQQRARRIAERTNTRITLVQMRCAQAVRAQIKALEHGEETATGEHDAYRLQPPVLAALAEQVAAQLTCDRSLAGREHEHSDHDG